MAFGSDDDFYDEVPEDIVEDDLSEVEESDDSVDPEMYLGEFGPDENTVGLSEPTPDQDQKHTFNTGDAFVVGSMIFGNMYEESMDRKAKNELLKQKKKKNLKKL